MRQSVMLNIFKSLQGLKGISQQWQKSVTILLRGADAINTKTYTNTEHGPANIRNLFEMLFKLFPISDTFSILILKKNPIISSDR